MKYLLNLVSALTSSLPSFAFDSLVSISIVIVNFAVKLKTTATIPVIKKYNSITKKRREKLCNSITRKSQVKYHINFNS